MTIRKHLLKLFHFLVKKVRWDIRNFKPKIFQKLTKYFPPQIISVVYAVKTILAPPKNGWLNSVKMTHYTLLESG